MESCVRFIVVGMMLLISPFLYASDAEVSDKFLPTNASFAHWVFSGVAMSAEGERFGYFFELQRDGNKLHATAALLDGDSKQVLLFDEGDAFVGDSTPYHWRVGRAFLRFNPINDSWIFGLKAKDKKGFNFKVDMLQQPESIPIAQDLRPGVELIVSQTNHLNGHLQVESSGKEQFVTAKNAWFRQIWLTGRQDKKHLYSGVLCRFNDDSGFFSVNTSDRDALQGAVAGWRDSKGLAVAMSQFVSVKEEPKDNSWHIRMLSPSLHLILSNVVKQDAIVAGFVTNDKAPGFCVLSNDILGEQTV